MKFSEPVAVLIDYDIGHVKSISFIVGNDVTQVLEKLEPRNVSVARTLSEEYAKLIKNKP